MYVFGKLSDTDKVIVEIGTGYYVEKDIPSSRDYFTKKVKYVTEQVRPH
jgi:prefoldin alpha subunit